MTKPIRLAYSWHCLVGKPWPHCDASGHGDGSDLAARKHETATGHPTITRAEPEKP